VVEAQLCGTPVITTDWGGFTETVDEGVSGYRCRSLADFLAAWEKVGRLDRTVIRKRALERWSAPVAKALYTAWFDAWRRSGARGGTPSPARSSRGRAHRHERADCIDGTPDPRSVAGQS